MGRRQGPAEPGPDDYAALRSTETPAVLLEPTEPNPLRAQDPDAAGASRLSSTVDDTTETQDNAVTAFRLDALAGRARG